MIPSLRRFYGGTATEWLAMPMSLLNIHAEALPRLQAQEALLGATVAAMGAGNMKRSQAESVRREWQRLARGPRRKAARQGRTSDLGKYLGAFGIGFKEA